MTELVEARQKRHLEGFTHQLAHFFETSKTQSAFVLLKGIQRLQGQFSISSEAANPLLGRYGYQLVEKHPYEWHLEKAAKPESTVSVELKPPTVIQTRELPKITRRSSKFNSDGEPVDKRE